MDRKTVLLYNLDDPENALYTEIMESGLRRDSTQVQGWGHALRSVVFHHQQRDDVLGISLDAFNAFLAAKPEFVSLKSTLAMDFPATNAAPVKGGQAASPSPPRSTDSR